MQDSASILDVGFGSDVLYKIPSADFIIERTYTPSKEELVPRATQAVFALVFSSQEAELTIVVMSYLQLLGTKHFVRQVGNLSERFTVRLTS